jgi:hypothetical protein
MTKKRVLSIAYHEAGHAVAARLVKPPVMVKYVTIIPDEHNLGHCKGGDRLPKNFKPDSEVSPLTRNRIEAQVIYYLAGYVAEEKFMGRKPRGCKPDIQTALNLACYVAGGGKPLEAYFAWLWAQTEALFQNPFFWKCVEAVAEKLAIERKLSGAKVEHIMRVTFNA